VLSYTCDVRDEQQVEELMSFAVEELGRIDVLVNNAGVGYLMAPVTEVDEADWDAVLDVNLKGTFLCTKHAARAMIDQGTGGCIVNISSQGGKSGFPEASAYVSSKHGVIGFTRSASMDLAPHGIRVNAVCPNHVTTGLARGRTSTSPGGPVSRCPSTSRACEHGSPSVVTELLGTPPTRASSWPVMRRRTSPARPERFRRRGDPLMTGALALAQGADVPSSRTQLIDTAVAEMRSDAAAVTEVTLTYLEPLVLSRIA